MLRRFAAPANAHSSVRTIPDAFLGQIERFAAAVRGEAAPAVGGADGRRTVELIEQTLAARVERSESRPPVPAGRWRIGGAFAGERVLVTGGSGFIGGASWSA